MNKNEGIRLFFDDGDEGTDGHGWTVAPLQPAGLKVMKSNGELVSAGAPRFASLHDALRSIPQLFELVPVNPKGTTVNLDEHRIRLAMAGDTRAPDLDTEPIAYVEAVWGSDVYGFNALVKDLEDLRQGGDGVELGAPRTHYEAELLVSHTRALANDIARKFGLHHLIRESDDMEKK